MQVVDKQSGKSVEDVRVSLLEDRQDIGAFEWGYHDLFDTRRHTDAAGAARFAEPGCQDGMLLVRRGGYARQRLALESLDKVVKIELEPAAKITGQVKLGSRLLTEGLVGLVTPRDAMAVNLEDSQGMFEFEEMPAGDYELTVWDTAHKTLYVQKITLEAGEARTEAVEVAEE